MTIDPDTPEERIRASFAADLALIQLDHERREAADQVVATTPDHAALGVLLTAIQHFIRRYVVLSADAAVLMALWVAETYAIEAFDYIAYLHVKSPMPECGKTRCLEVLESLVPQPWLTGRVTAAVLMRKVDAVKPVLLLDESDAAFNGDPVYAEALRGMLNSGFHREGKASVCVGQGSSLTYKDFSTFGPKAIAGIGRLPSTIESRSIPIALSRRTKEEPITKWRRRDAWVDAEILRTQLATTLQGTIFETLRRVRPTVPNGLSDRAEDVLEPLFAIADAAGGVWPQQARRAALALMGCSARIQQEVEQNLGVELLADIRGIFTTAEDNPDMLATAVIIAGLIALEDRPWSTYAKGDKPITAHKLSRLLRDFGVLPGGDARINGKVRKMYRRVAFEEAFARYLPNEPQQGNTTSEIGPDTGQSEPQQLRGVAHTKVAVPIDEHWPCCVVAISTPHRGSLPRFRHGSFPPESTTERFEL